MSGRIHDPLSAVSVSVTSKSNSQENGSRNTGLHISVDTERGIQEANEDFIVPRHACWSHYHLSDDPQVRFLIQHVR